MAGSREREEFAILIQGAMDELKEQREQNALLLEQNKRLLEQVSNLVSVEEPSSGRHTRAHREKVSVSLQTRVRKYTELEILYTLFQAKFRVENTILFLCIESCALSLRESYAKR